MRCHLNLVTFSNYVGIYVILLYFDIRAKLDCAIQVRDGRRTGAVWRLEDAAGILR